MSKNDNLSPQSGRFTTWQTIPDAPTAPTTPGIDWQTRNSGARPMLRHVERLALAIEKPINKIVGTPELNPFYHTGTIAFFLLAVVFGTGLYLLMFYQYGATVSHQSVTQMENFLISRIARGVHRYASGGLMIFSLLHAFRMLFQGRFHGARWMAWVGGVVSAAMIWLAGVTGYWLIWDQGSQLISQAFVMLLSPLPNLATAFYHRYLDPAGADNIWQLMFALMIIHVALSVITAFFFWVHIKRLNRPAFFPPRHWMIIMGVSLIIMSLLFPLGMLPIADFTQMPGQIYIDLIYLFYIPPTLTEAPLLSWVGVAMTVIVWGVFTFIPWLIPTKNMPAIQVDTSRCTGCEFCAEDCPYDVFTMEERKDDSPYEYVAVANPELCVSCGICIGSCSTLALTLGDNPIENLWAEVNHRVIAAQNENQTIKIIFACERHAAQSGIFTHQDAAAHVVNTVRVETIPVLCGGMVHPDLMTRTLNAGASEVEVIACPAHDCANREGSVWMEQRFTRERSPKLKKSQLSLPVQGAMLPPDAYGEIIPLMARQNPEESKEAITQLSRVMTTRNLIYLAILLAIGLVIQVGFTYVPYTSQQDIQQLIDSLAS